MGPWMVMADAKTTIVMRGGMSVEGVGNGKCRCETRCAEDQLGVAIGRGAGRWKRRGLDGRKAIVGGLIKVAASSEK